jgi:predicted RNase H-like nuclease (RuvC/YqgF family)
MKTLTLRFCLITAWLVLVPLTDLSIAAQSLVDAARREAERREGLEQLGIEETVIEGNGESYSEEGNVSVLGTSGTTSPKKSAAPSSAKNQSSLSRYRKTIQKLDQNILKEEERIKRLQDRLDDLRREGYRIGDLAKRRRNEESQNRTREQIEELEVNLKLMREERRDEYDSGKKAGFLPGELDGKGIVP